MLGLVVTLWPTETLKPHTAQEKEGPVMLMVRFVPTDKETVEGLTPVIATLTSAVTTIFEALWAFLFTERASDDPVVNSTTSKAHNKAAHKRNASWSLFFFLIIVMLY